MLKIGLVFFSLFMLIACGSAQQRYSSTNKKAISLFEEGQKAPSANRDPKTGGLNYQLGIELMEKAIQRDPNFWEAFLVAGEFAEYSGKFDAAIKYYEEAIRIKPNHTATGSTFFFLGNLKYSTGDYQGSIDVLSKYVQNRNANPELVQTAKKIMESCDFSILAMKNAFDFNPVNIGPGINTDNPEYFPTITVDGKTILFTRRIKDNRVLGPFKEQEDFFVSQLSDKNIWMKATPMPANINTVNNEGAPTISADGRTLIFVGCPDPAGEYGEGRNGKGSCDLFITKKIGSKWTDPINLPGYVNSQHWETQPSLSSDGKTLYFIRGIRGQGNKKSSDIYVSNLQDDGLWGMPVRLPDHINSPMEEESVLIHPDGKTLYFASRGHVGMGGSDLFMAKKDDKGNWSNPINLGYPINTKFDENSLMVSPDGEIAFFASNREGGYGDLDIYYFNLPEHLRPVKTLYFEGIVYDVNTKKPIPGKFQLIDIQTGDEVIRSEADLITGEFMVSLPVNKEYALNVSYKGYNAFSENFNMTLTEDQEAFKMDVPMIPIGSKEPVLLANVFFDLNKTTLRKESFIELNKLRDFLKENPTMKIEIGGHTDTRGDAKDNQILSEGRANSVMNYLIKEGIESKRLTAKGYGESLPVVSDEEIAKLSSVREQEKAHQKNRRTEYKFVP
jgi:outer membrane protein OmpA-like peptidoglycan-associated protein/tetratricopeptide (TPR) repeat protein